MLSSISNSEAAKQPAQMSAILAFFSSAALAVFVMAGLTEWLIRAEVLPQDTRAAHLHILENSEAMDAVFGDSHAARGFDAGGGFINLAYPSENIEDMALKAKLYFAERDPGRVILQADPHMFARYRVFAGLNSEDASDPTLQLQSPRHRNRALGYWETFLREGGRMTSKISVTDAGSLLSEGDFSTVAPRRRMLEAQVRGHWHRVEASDAVLAAREEYTKLLDWFTARGARLCLVSYPVTPQYADAVADANHEPEIAFYASEAERVGARFVDMRYAVQDLRSFRDPDHLNIAGAIAFSPALTEACFGSAKRAARDQ